LANRPTPYYIVLDSDRHGTWHTPPDWINSTFQLAGFVMNSFGAQGDGENAGSSRDFFYITPGWHHFRLVETIGPGPDVSYRNYVRMFPVDGEPGAFAGDIYLLRDEKVVGVCAGIKFKRVPRALMPIMFPRSQAGKARNHGVSPANVNSNSNSHNIQAAPTLVSSVSNNLNPPIPIITNSPQQDQIDIVQPTQPVPSCRPVTQHGGQNPRVVACLRLLADETGLDLDDLSGKATFAELGVDSLMPLALSEKIHVELGVDIKASIFIQCTTVQDLVHWLSKHS
jgi:asperthecin polyketide synthase